MAQPLTLKLPKGTSRDFPLQVYNADGTAAADVFEDSDVLAVQVWAGDGQPVLLTPAATWIDASAGTFQISFDDADTSDLAPSTYRIAATATRSGRSGALLPSGSRLVLLDAPGDAVLADLVTQDRLAAALGDMDLTTAQQEVLPELTKVASDLIRRYCGDRDFNQQEYDRIFPVGPDGAVSLPQIPVLKVSRVCASRSTGLTVSNTDRTTNQRATVEFACTGDEAAGITYTGLILTRTASGVTTSITRLFATYVTLSALATAVNALGNGWSATIAQGQELRGTAELIAQDDAAQDAFAGAVLEVWAEDLAGAKLNKRTGTLDVGGAGGRGIDGPRWGPGWETFADDTREAYGRVRVVYTAGFVTIPAVVQQATVETVIDLLNLQSLDQRLSSESDGARSYVLNTAFAAQALTPSVAGKLSPYVLHRT